MVPNQKVVTDISEVKISDIKLYISAMFDCYDLLLSGLCIEDNMKAEMCVNTIKNTIQMHPEIHGIICHSDCGSQYTSKIYRAALNDNLIIQSMNNANFELMWTWMKEKICPFAVYSG